MTKRELTALIKEVAVREIRKKRILENTGVSEVKVYKGIVRSADYSKPDITVEFSIRNDGRVGEGGKLYFTYARKVQNYTTNRRGQRVPTFGTSTEYAEGSIMIQDIIEAVNGNKSLEFRSMAGGYSMDAGAVQQLFGGETGILKTYNLA